MKKALVLLSLVLICLFVFDGTVNADLVVMKNGIHYKCKILKDDPNEDSILVRIVQNDGTTGTITIARRNIQRIEYDYDSRKTRLAKEDFPGYYDLAKFCLEHSMDDKALDALEVCAGKKDVPTDAWLLLARLYEKNGQLQKALDAYVTYYNANNNDVEVYKKIQELKKQLTPPSPIPSPSPIVSETPQPSQSPPQTTSPVEIRVLEGLEAQLSWSVAPWAGPAELSAEVVGKNKILTVKYQEPGTFQKSATFLVLTKSITRSKAKMLSMKVNNGISNPIQISLALWLGESLRNGKYFESPTKLAASGKWVNLDFDLTANWKCEPDWTYTEKLPDDEIWVVFLLVYPGQNAGTIQFDEIAFDTGG